MTAIFMVMTGIVHYPGKALLLLANLAHLFYHWLTASKPIGGLNIPTCGCGIGKPSWPTQEFAVTRYILRGCRRCGGDLFLHDQYRAKDDWRCMQCGRYRHHHQHQLPATTHEHLMPRTAVQSTRTGRAQEPGE